MLSCRQRNIYCKDTNLRFSQIVSLSPPLTARPAGRRTVIAEIRKQNKRCSSLSHVFCPRIPSTTARRAQQLLAERQQRTPRQMQVVVPLVLRLYREGGEVGVGGARFFYFSRSVVLDHDRINLARQTRPAPPNWVNTIFVLSFARGFFSLLKLAKRTTEHYCPLSLHRPWPIAVYWRHNGTGVPRYCHCHIRIDTGGITDAGQAGSEADSVHHRSSIIDRDEKVFPLSLSLSCRMFNRMFFNRLLYFPAEPMVCLHCPEYPGKSFELNTTGFFLSPTMDKGPRSRSSIMTLFRRDPSSSLTHAYKYNLQYFTIFIFIFDSELENSSH